MERVTFRMQSFPCWIEDDERGEIARRQWRWRDKIGSRVVGCYIHVHAVASFNLK